MQTIGLVRTIANAGLDTSNMSEMFKMLIPVFIVVMVLVFVFKFIKEHYDKKRSKEKVELPRDASERLIRAWKKLSKSKLNWSGLRHTIWVSGDEMRDGFRSGDVIDIRPQNEIVCIAIKRRWWYFWRDPMFLFCLPEQLSDFNSKHIVLECRGIRPIQENIYVPIPCQNTKSIERYYEYMDKAISYQIMLLTSSDLSFDADWLPKMAMRGDMPLAMMEVGRLDSMPQTTQGEMDKMAREQGHPLNDNPTGGSQG
jgi:hypothetical protein